MKILKNKWLWAIIGILAMPVLLKLDGILKQDFRFGIIPFVIIGIYWFVYFVVLAKCAPADSKRKLAFVYISLVPLCFALGEFIFALKTKQLELTQPHEILGFDNKKDVIIRANPVVGGVRVYDVMFTFDKNGVRKTTNNAPDSKKCLHFYGGSFMLGAALNDSETLSSFMAKKLNKYDEKYSFFNNGVSGTGAAQMLAKLEFDINKNAWDSCDENLVIYNAIPHHIYRAHGAFGGPKYELENGKAIYKRPVTKAEQEALTADGAAYEAQKRFSFVQKIANQLCKSRILSPFMKHCTPFDTSVEIYKNGYFSIFDHLRLNTDSDLEIYFQIIRQSRDLLREKYNAELVIVLWDKDMHAEFLDKYDEALKAFFKREKIRFYALSEMIDDYYQDLERVKAGDFENFKYRISKYDTHPNALANEKIAEFLADKIKNGELKLRQK